MVLLLFLGQLSQAQTDLLSRVKTALSQCKVDGFFAVRAALVEATEDEQAKIAKYFAERIKAASECDSYESLLGLQLLSKKSGMAVEELMKKAIIASRRSDLLNGPQPRLAALLETMQFILTNADGALDSFFDLLPSLGTLSEQQLLFAAVPVTSWPWSATTLAANKDEAKNKIEAKARVQMHLQELWSFSMAMTDADLKNSKVEKELKEGRLRLLARTQQIFTQQSVLAKLIESLNSAEDLQFQNALLSAILKSDALELKEDLLKKIILAKLNPSQRASLFSKSKIFVSERDVLYRESTPLSTSSCRISNLKFDIELRNPPKSPSMPSYFPEEESMIWIKKNNEAYPLVGSWNSRNGGISFLNSNLNSKRSSKTICQGIESYAFGHLLILPFELEDRPFGSGLSLALIDLDPMRVLDIVDPGGNIPKGPKFQKIAKGVRFQTQLQPSDSAEEKNVLVRGQIAEAVEDQVLELIFNFNLNQKEWSLVLDKNQMWRHSPYKKFFKNQNEFVETFFLNGQRSQLQDELDPIHWVRVAVKNGRTFCIYPSVTRDLPANQEKWRCVLPKEGKRNMDNKLAWYQGVCKSATVEYPKLTAPQKNRMSKNISEAKVIEQILGFLDQLPTSGDIMVSMGPTPVTKLTLHCEKSEHNIEFFGNRIKTPHTSFFADVKPAEKALFELLQKID